MDYTSTGAAPVKTGKADRRADLPFLVITLTLLGVGVVMVLSASLQVRITICRARPDTTRCIFSPGRPSSPRRACV